MFISKIILSSDENHDYLQLWPLAAAAWSKGFGIQPVLAFLSNREESDPLFVELRKHGIVIPFRILDDVSIPIGIQAKVTRMTLACEYPSDTILLGDIDVLPINALPFIKNLLTIPRDHFVSFGANAYHETADHGKFPMNFLVAQGSTFRTIVNPNNLDWFDLLKSWCDIYEPLDGKESVNQPFAHFSDESLLRYLCTKWEHWDNRYIDIPRAVFQQDQIPYVQQKVGNGNGNSTETKRVRAFIATYSDRIDRQNDRIVIRREPKKNNEGQIELNIQEFTDIHSCRPLQKHIAGYLGILRQMNLDIDLANVIPYHLQSHHWITGNDFLHMCNHVIDERFFRGQPLNLNAIQPGDRIFLKTDLLPFFFENLISRIKVPFVLVTHNSDHSAPGKYHTFLDSDKVIHWFGQNCDLSEIHPKFTPIPIGLANFRMRPTGEFVPHSNQPLLLEFSKKSEMLSQKEHGSRISKIFANFHLSKDRFGHRVEAGKALGGKSFVEAQMKQLSFPEYLNLMSKFAFVASPHGNGLDCHRTYEALIMGCIPIVKTSSLDQLYLDNKLPVLIVKEWTDIDKELLIRFSQKFEGKSHLFAENPSLTVNYWKRKLTEVSTKFGETWSNEVD